MKAMNGNVDKSFWSIYKHSQHLTAKNQNLIFYVNANKIQKLNVYLKKENIDSWHK